MSTALAHKVVIKSIVQARLPAMGHIPPDDQRTIVRLMVDQELARRKKLFPQARPVLQRLEKQLNTTDFDRFWHLH